MSKLSICFVVITKRGHSLWLCDLELSWVKGSHILIIVDVMWQSLQTISCHSHILSCVDNIFVGLWMLDSWCTAIRKGCCIEELQSVIDYDGKGWTF